MALITIPRTPWIDDDGSGKTGTVLNNAIKTELYNQIDAALADVAGARVAWTPTLTGSGGGTVTYGARGAYYYVAGKLCFVEVDLTCPTVGAGSGTLAISGCPLAPSNGLPVTMGPPAYVMGFGLTAPPWTFVNLAAYAGNASFQIHGHRTNSSDIAAMTWANLQPPVTLTASILFSLP